MADIIVGTAPDSWGVWFPSNPKQVPYQTFLDEVAAAGYEWIELGPYGYLPTDPAQLKDELDARGLKLSGGTVSERLHQPDSWDAVWNQVTDVAALTATMGGEHVVVLPEMHKDLFTGASLEPAELTADQWEAKTSGVDRLARAMLEEYGVHLQYHPHADSHVETEADVDRFLAATDPELVSLCLDTGHISYADGDNLAIIAKHPSRIGYLHLKQVDPTVMVEVRSKGLPFSEAVKLGAMVEPPLGVPEMPSLLSAVHELRQQSGRDIFAIVEQDLYPCDPAVPGPIARRTQKYLGSCGVAAVRFD